MLKCGQTFHSNAFIWAHSSFQRKRSAKEADPETPLWNRCKCAPSASLLSTTPLSPSGWCCYSVCEETLKEQRKWVASFQHRLWVKQEGKAMGECQDNSLIFLHILFWSSQKNRQKQTNSNSKIKIKKCSARLLLYLYFQNGCENSSSC